MDCGGCAEEPQKQFVMDGEAVILGLNGISDFDAMATLT